MRLAVAACALNLFAFGNDTETLAAHADQIDVAAPNWFAMDRAGRLRTGGGVRVAGAGGRGAAGGAATAGGPAAATGDATVTATGRSGRAVAPAEAADPAYLRAAGRGTEVWPVVNATLGFRWLQRPRVAARRIARVARAFDGVTLDVEEIAPQARGAYSRFVADVKRRAGDRGVAVYTVRRTSDPPLRSAAAYDHAALAGSADLVLASGYGEHSPASTPGPITTTAGFQRVLDHARIVSTRKVAPVLGGFGVSWPLLRPGRGEVVPAPDHTTVGLDGARVVWGETARTLDARKRAACAAGFRWIGLFSLGREPAGFWN